MKDLSVFTVNDHQSFLAAYIEAHEERGLISKLADVAQCQRSHMSRVLQGKLHLTLEQAFRVSQFLDLSGIERRYFLKLVEYDRAGDREYRKSLSKELEQIRKANEDLSGRMSDQRIGNQEKEILYYSSWYWSAIHIIVSIPQFQNVKAIASHLSLPEQMVIDCLQKLESMNLVRKNKDRWEIASGSIHLPQQSTLNPIQHSNWRQRAVLASQKPEANGIHYTVVQSVSLKDFEKIKEQLLGFIDQYSETARASAEEKLICFTCDFFEA